MYWPIMTDYQEAIQSPKTCFADNELRDGRLDFDSLGLPRPISGNFACVYGLTYRTSKWAVRCFLKNTQDQEKRYQFINSYLEKVHSPYFVPFKYIRNGIKVKGVWYPILKMEWINGESLSTYIEKNLTNPTAIQTLTQKFTELAKNLDQNAIAHGDLQHGNIIIVSGEIKLVDYDGMYVPGLDGMPSNEIGHPNYQHPIRSEKDFGPYLDRFSEWIIYLSLKAISLDPSLWMTLKGGDENLILRKADFNNPFSSDSLKIIENQHNQELKKIVMFLREIINCSKLPDLPKLDGNTVSGFDRMPIMPSWVVNTGITSTTPSWVLDYIDVNRFEFVEDMNFERRSLTVFVLALLVTLAFFVLREISYAIFLFFMIAEPSLIISLIYLRYNKNAKVQEKQNLLSQKKNIHENITQLDSRIEELKTKLFEITNEEKISIAALNQRANRIAQLEQNEISLVDEEVNNQLQSLDGEIRKLNNEEAEAFKKNLVTCQEDFINNNLAGILLAEASIRGFGDEIKKRFSDAGIFTAADIVDYQTSHATPDREIAFLIIKGKGSIHVNGIGPAKAKLLLEWRRNLEQQYKFSLPKVVPPQISAQIKTEYEDKRAYLQNQILIAKPEADQRKSMIHTRYRNALEQNRNEVKRINRYYLEKRNEQEEAIADQYKEIIKLNWEQTSLNKQLSDYKKINPFHFLKRVLQI